MIYGCHSLYPGSEAISLYVLVAGEHGERICSTMPCLRVAGWPLCEQNAGLDGLLVWSSRTLPMFLWPLKYHSHLYVFFDLDLLLQLMYDNPLPPRTQCSQNQEWNEGICSETFSTGPSFWWWLCVYLYVWAVCNGTPAQSRHSIVNGPSLRRTTIGYCPKFSCIMTFEVVAGEGTYT